MAGRQAGFFDVDERLQRLSSLGDQLEAYAKAVDFELFRPELETALACADGAKGGRLYRLQILRHRFAPTRPWAGCPVGRV